MVRLGRDVWRTNDTKSPMRTLLSYLFLLAAVVTAHAQDDPEYRMEVGAGFGLVNYFGDFNGKATGELQPLGTLIAKFRPNPRMVWAVNVSYGKLKGQLGKAETWFPDAEQLPASFSNSLIDACMRFEYNFWAYGTGREYYGARRLAPFLAFGLGLTHVSQPSSNVLAANMLLGVGLKYKVADRLNLTAEWMMHFAGSDRLDGVEDPYTIKSSGLFKNTDCYGVLQLTLTYDIWAKCKTCNNDRD